MEKQFFHIKLVSPRPSFPFDMNERERALMNEHIVYWKRLTEEGTAVLFGPVMDPSGPYGLGIVEVSDETAARNVVDNDPTIRSGIGFTYSISSMRIGMVRKEQGT